jgi:uncharacterized Fe-S center protein
MKVLVLFLLSLIYCAEKADVYFTKIITPDRMVDMFKKLNVKLTGNVGLKVHSGETGGLYFLKPDFLQKIYDYTNGTYLECNTAYNSQRSNSDTHKQLLNEHAWYANGRRMDLMDENPDEDIKFRLKNFNQIDVTYAGAHLEKYDSCVVLSHFKGHPMGGFGGALKQLSIGFASQRGKTWIHSGGRILDWRQGISGKATQEEFTNAMGDAASAIVDYFKGKGQIVYLNVLANISKSCDCAGKSAPAPKIKDIGILASTDPVAIDQACLDLIKKTTDEGTQDLLNQINKLLGENTIKAAEKLGVGTTEYNLIDVDEEEGE